MVKLDGQGCKILKVYDERASAIIDGAGVDEADIGLVVSDLGGRVVDTNRAIEKLLGYSAEEMNGTPFCEYSHANGQHTCADYLNSLVEGESDQYRIEKRLRRKDGTLVLGRVDVAIVRDYGGQPLVIIGMVQDMTRRKRIEEQLMQAQRMEEIGRRVAGIVHDFRNQLTAIMCSGEIGARALPPGDTVRDHFQEITRTAKRAANLTRRLLAYSGPRSSSSRAVNLNDILRDMEVMLRRLISEDIELVAVYQRDLWLVKMDPDEMGQIVTNLVVNASDAMPDGGKLTLQTANVTIDESFAPERPGMTPGEYVRLSVSDNGVGRKRSRLVSSSRSSPPRTRGPVWGLPRATESPSKTAATSRSIADLVGGLPSRCTCRASEWPGGWCLWAMRYRTVETAVQKGLCCDSLLHLK